MDRGGGGGGPCVWYMWYVCIKDVKSQNINLTKREWAQRIQALRPRLFVLEAAKEEEGGGSHA